MSYWIVSTIVWVLIIYGFSSILVEAQITQFLRKLIDRLVGEKYNIFNCILCTSVWVTILVTCFIYSPTMNLWTQLSYKTLHIIFCDVMLGSSLSYFLFLFEKKMGG